MSNSTSQVQIAKLRLDKKQRESLYISILKNDRRHKIQNVNRKSKSKSGSNERIPDRELPRMKETSISAVLRCNLG
jgi:hypothetical protein